MWEEEKEEEKRQRPDAHLLPLLPRLFVVDSQRREAQAERDEEEEEEEEKVVAVEMERG